MNSDQLSQIYRQRFSPDELVQKDRIWQVLCAQYFQQWIDPQGVVVDVACGHGEFINHIQARRKLALDLNPETAQYLHPNVEFHLSDALLLSQVVSEAADVVFTSNFLEHLPHRQALESFLEQVHKALKPGGRYLIMGPNLRYLPGQYWDFYDHTLGLTHLSLAEGLITHGFQIERCVDRFLPYSTKSSLPRAPWLVSLYLKLPLFWPLLGRQFMIVARKPAAL